MCMLICTRMHVPFLYIRESFRYKRPSIQNKLKYEQLQTAKPPLADGESEKKTTASVSRSVLRYLEDARKWALQTMKCTKVKDIKTTKYLKP